MLTTLLAYLIMQGYFTSSKSIIGEKSVHTVWARKKRTNFEQKILHSLGQEIIFNLFVNMLYQDESSFFYHPEDFLYRFFQYFFTHFSNFYYFSFPD